MKEMELKERSSRSLLANVLDLDDDFRQVNNTQNIASSGGNNCGGFIRVQPSGALDDPSTAMHSCFSIQRELIAILKELRYVTNKMREKDETDEVASDWKFGAMVIDRLCLILFSVFTVVSTCVCILRAEHLTS